MLPSFHVMNNMDLRRIIFSFLGKRCSNCKKWINDNHYISFSNDINCFCCFAKNYRKIMEINKKYYLKNINM